MSSSDMRHIPYGKWCQRSLWRQLAFASCEFHYNTFLPFFWFSITTLSYIHWHQPYRSFKHSNWWRHKL